MGTAIAVVAGTGTATAQETYELPPVVVEGATLDAKTKRQTAQPAPSGAASQQATSASASNGGSDDGVGTLSGDAPAGDTTSGGTGSGGVEARKLGTPVTVVTGEELKARQIRNAADALRSMPGVAVSSSGSGGSATQVRIRGAEGNHTLVIIDGVEANDTSIGEFDFSNLAADDIERIEVIRGGQSGLYGSRAIGGVINIVTRGGKGPLTFRGRVEGGSFGTRDVAGGVSAGNERGYFSAGYSYRETDGFNIAPLGNEDDGYDRRTFNLRAGVTVADGISLDVNLRNTRTFSEFDAFGFAAPPGVLQTAEDSDNTSETVTWLGGGKLTWDMFGGGLTHVVGGNFNMTTLESTDPFSTATYDNERNRFFYLGTARFGSTEQGLRHTLSGLIEKEMESFTPDIAFFTDNEERERERIAYAAEYRGEILDRIFPTASVRHEDNDSFEDFTTWKTGLSVDLREIRLRPHASAGTAVALPGMFEQFGAVLGTFVGNPNLVPEESFGWDAGVEVTLVPGVAVVDVTYFESDLQNEIVGFGDTLINLDDESHRRGIEVAGRFNVTREITLGAAYTWLDASDPTGLAEVRRPEHTARFDVNYVFDHGRGNINLAAIYNGEATDLAFLNLAGPPFFGSQFVTLDEYWLVNVAASYKLAPGVELYGRVENLLDENYQEVFGFETADVAAYVGMRFTYEEEATRAWSEGR